MNAEESRTYIEGQTSVLDDHVVFDRLYASDGNQKPTGVVGVEPSVPDHLVRFDDEIVQSTRVRVHRDVVQHAEFGPVRTHNGLSREVLGEYLCHTERCVFHSHKRHGPCDAGQTLEPASRASSGSDQSRGTAVRHPLTGVPKRRKLKSRARLVWGKDSPR